jgi:hypothetical protein
MTSLFAGIPANLTRSPCVSYSICEKGPDAIRWDCACPLYSRHEVDVYWSPQLRRFRRAGRNHGLAYPASQRSNARDADSQLNRRVRGIVQDRNRENGAAESGSPKGVPAWQALMMRTRRRQRNRAPNLPGPCRQRILLPPRLRGDRRIRYGNGCSDSDSLLRSWRPGSTWPPRWK